MNDVLPSNPAGFADRSMLDFARVTTITRQLYERKQFAFLIVSADWEVVEVSANFSDYGFDAPEIGSDARDTVDFLVGLDSNSALDLPIVLSPSQQPLHIVLLPENGQLTIVLMDASQVYKQRQMVQQQANENALLLAQQRRLTDQLEIAKQDLENKNQQLKEAGRLQSSFLSGVSHEFRTPLASMLGYIELLSERFDTQSREESRAQLNVVMRSTRHLLSLVENLLDHGKFDADEVVLTPVPTELKTLYREVRAMLEPAAINKGIELTMSTASADLPTCLIDPARFRQIPLNIIGNAIKFTDVGSVRVSLGHENEALSLSVQDSGIGISAANLSKITQPFWQASQHERVGTGLGLTITDKIVEMMGGELSVRSNLGEGTIVNIRLPAPCLPEELELPINNEAFTQQGRHFLLAEDDADIANLVALLLNEKGVKVTRVENGEQAIQAVSAQKFDLILMDLQMPIVDGYEASRRIRKAGVSTPILVMTASALEADRSLAEQVGCDGYLIKPVVIDELLNLANQLMQTETELNEHLKT